MKSAQSVSQKFVERAGAASGDYLKGAKDTTKDPIALAVAAIPRLKIALLKAIDSGRMARNMQAAGKSGWLAGIIKKGEERFGSGVAASAAKYATNSGKFDSARGAADSMPTGDKGSATNLAKVGAVVNALRAAKVGAA